MVPSRTTEITPRPINDFLGKFLRDFLVLLFMPVQILSLGTRIRSFWSFQTFLISSTDWYSCAGFFFTERLTGRSLGGFILRGFPPCFTIPSRLLLILETVIT